MAVGALFHHPISVLRGPIKSVVPVSEYLTLLRILGVRPIVRYDSVVD